MDWMNSIYVKCNLVSFVVTFSAKIFQASKCSVCSHPLDVPSVHFLCQHSYHQQWVRHRALSWVLCSFQTPFTHTPVDVIFIWNLFLRNDHKLLLFLLELLDMLYVHKHTHMHAQFKVSLPGYEITYFAKNCTAQVTIHLKW